MTKDDSRALSLGSFAVAVAALVFAGMVLIFDTDQDGSASSNASFTTIEITLTEMAITPNKVTLPPEGARLRLVNAGASVHTFAIDGLVGPTDEIDPGEELTIAVGPSAEGTYAMYCTVAGHRDAGMTGIAMVGSGGGHGGDGHEMTWQEMDAAMKDVALRFPATTAGLGGQLLAPTVLADGTKQFDITVESVKWEVSPGTFVDAMTYNGVVPGPLIKVDVGDKVRMNVTNELSESTVVHFHGIRVPNSMDGVPPYTQDVITPGSSFVYEFTAIDKAVGIYHSHHDAQVQVPNGLFGAFIIGDYDIPDVLRDKGYTRVDKTVNMVLNDSGTIGLTLNGKSFPATEPYTLKVGQVMMVHYYNEGNLGHPMHLHQPSGWIIAKDGVEMLVPIPGDTIWIGPGERYTVIYRAVDPGVWAWHCHILTHAESPTGMFGMVTALIVEE
jgi:manganese oxidase